jgi:hypothetical protein
MRGIYAGIWGNGVIRALGVDAGLAPAVMKNKQRTSSTRINSRLSDGLSENAGQESEIIFVPQFFRYQQEYCIAPQVQVMEELENEYKYSNKPCLCYRG